MTNKQKLKSGLPLAESSFGKLTGGFFILDASENANLLGGSEETNNCHGGNCVSGCGSNLSAQCGHNTNTVAGCGSKQTLSAY